MKNKGIRGKDCVIIVLLRELGKIRVALNTLFGSGLSGLRIKN
jgi:hypothetical protein